MFSMFFSFLKFLGLKYAQSHAVHWTQKIRRRSWLHKDYPMFCYG